MDRVPVGTSSAPRRHSCGSGLDTPRKRRPDGVQDDGYEAYFQEGAVFAGTAAWDLDWYSAPGTEDEDRDLFLTMISTFRQTP